MHVQLELWRSATGALSGRVMASDGSPQPFDGVMGLVAALEQLLDDRPTDAAPPS